MIAEFKATYISLDEPNICAIHYYIYDYPNSKYYVRSHIAYINDVNSDKNIDKKFYYDNIEDVQKKIVELVELSEIKGRVIHPDEFMYESEILDNRDPIEKYFSEKND